MRIGISPSASRLFLFCWLALFALAAGCGPKGDRMDARMATAPVLMQAASMAFVTDRFDKLPENKFHETAVAPLSTFSIDVDTASYNLARHFLEDGQWPPVGAVRTEELINYFRYAYPAPADDKTPCSITADMGPAFWQPEHRLLRVALKAKDIDWNRRSPSNLVFLLDVSGSMYGPDRLDLVKKSMAMLVEQLDRRDTVSIVTYASEDRVALPPANGADKARILAALDGLEAGGGTAGSRGIVTAYNLAREHFIKNGVNRVILCTDGDFNMGVTSQSGLLALIRRQAESGVFLSVLGFGMGNYQDAMMVKLADSGNGMYGYINTPLEARRLFVEQVGASVITVARDVKVQVEFNPERVASYRLIGYEKRMLEAEDFNNDTVDAGEMGAGHTVTALYEIVPRTSGGTAGKGGVDPLRYASVRGPQQARGDFSVEWAQVKVRYKEPDGGQSRLISRIVRDGDYSAAPSPDFRMAEAVAAFGMILNDSPFKGRATLDMVLQRVSDPAVSSDVYRKEFVGLVAKAVQMERLRGVGEASE